MKTIVERNTSVIQGEHRISSDPGEVLVTVLGSCVAACMRDPVTGIGGLNHFLLPGSGSADQTVMKYGLQAMELLINSLIRAGADRRRLEVKLFGGAHLRAGMPDIGQSNAAFAESFLRAEGLRYVGGSLGGKQGRKIRFWPVTGLVRQFLLENSEVPIEKAVRMPPPPAHDIELF